MQQKLKKIIAFLLTVAIFFCFGCKTNHDLAKRIDKIFLSKRYKKSVQERDELYSKTEQLKSDTTVKSQRLHKLKDDFYDLEEKYRNLSTASGMKLAQLNEDLKNKSKELEKKERLLEEREARLNGMHGIIERQDSIVNLLNATVRNALLGFNHDELSVEMKNGKVYSMSDKLLFKSGSSM